ncbi:MAG: hypothetical protein WBZ29_16445 [Methanocella sp.]
MVVRNINLGTPYEEFIDRVIKKELAGNRTEVIRQALACYKREIELEEVILVRKAIDAEMAEIESGKQKTHRWEDVKKELGL